MTDHFQNATLCHRWFQTQPPPSVILFFHFSLGPQELLCNFLKAIQHLQNTFVRAFSLDNRASGVKGPYLNPFMRVLMIISSVSMTCVQCFTIVKYSLKRKGRLNLISRVDCLGYHGECSEKSWSLRQTPLSSGKMLNAPELWEPEMLKIRKKKKLVMAFLELVAYSEGCGISAPSMQQ